MADDIHVTGPGPNGERLEVNLKNRSIGLTTKDLVPILVVLGAFAGGILAAKVLFLGQERGHQLLGEITAQLHAHTAMVTAGQQDLRTHLDESLMRHNDLVQTQTQAIHTKVDTLEAYLEAWFRDLGHRLEILNFNLQHPDRTLPLRAPLPEEERRPDRGR